MRDDVDNARWFAFLLDWLMCEHARRDLGKIFKVLPRAEGAASLRGYQFTVCLREGSGVHEECAYREGESDCRDPVQSARYCTCRRVSLVRFIRILFPKGSKSVPVSAPGKDEIPRHDRRRWQAWITGEEPLPIRDAASASQFAFQAGLIDAHTAEVNARYFALMERVIEELQEVKASLKEWDRLFAEGKSLCFTQPASALFPDTLVAPRIWELDPGKDPWDVPVGVLPPVLGSQHPSNPWSTCKPQSRVMVWDHKPMVVTVFTSAYPMPLLDEPPFDGSDIAVRMWLKPFGPDLTPKSDKPRKRRGSKSRK